MALIVPSSQGLPLGNCLDGDWIVPGRLGDVTQYEQRFLRPGRHSGADGVSRCCALS
jgi:hypothetical protein